MQKQGGMLGLMSSYNAINGTMASSHEYLQLNVLRELWGYKGFTVTDWGGNDGFTLNKGTDIEMPSLSNNSKAQGDKKVEAGDLTQEELDKLVDDSVSHVLYALGHAGYLYLVETYEADGTLYAKEQKDRTEAIKLWGDSAAMAEAVQAENNNIVLDIARGGGVLLENDGVLPIAQDGSETVAVLGTGGKYTLSGTGGERSYGVGYEMTSPYESLKKTIGSGNVSLEPVFDNGGEAIPAENLFVKGENGEFTQGFHVKKNEENATTVTNQSIEYLPAARSFEGGTALDGSSANPDTYTWTTYVKVDKTGEYTFVLQGLGGTLTGDVTETADGDTPPASVPDANQDAVAQDEPAFPGFPGGGGGSKNDLSVSYSSSQGVQWHSGDYCTDTGMSISSGHKVTLEAGKYYKVEITGKANRDEKDMQLRLAWLTPDTSVSYDSQNDKLSGGAYQHAMGLAAEADVTVVFVDAKAQDKPSTRDADNLNVSAQQERLVLDAADAAHKAGKKIVVVINNETAITIHNWVDQVDAVLMMYRPGQKGGQATAELLTGVVNPSGRLAYTMPMEGNQTLITYTEEAWNKQTQKAQGGTTITADMLYALNDGELERYWRQVNMDLQIRLQLTFADVNEFRQALAPGAERRDEIAAIVNDKVNSGTISYYDEGILTGYRWYDSQNLEPRYDFGYGLSYTTFEYSNLSVVENKNGEKAGYDVTFAVKNTGAVAGSEVAQLYLGQADTSKLPSGIQSAPYQLAGYTKIKDLQPGESKTVTLHVNERALSYWNQTIEDAHADKWTLAEGSRTIYVGAASDDLRLSSTVTVGQTSTPVAPSNPSPSTPSTTTETRTNSDGTTTTIVTDNKTGTVTETTERTDGSKVEKITTGDKNVTITVTGKDGEVLAKAELPAEISAPATRFADVPEGHWADEAIHNMAGLNLVNGVGGNRFNLNGSMTRSDLATILFRAANGKAGIECSFEDVPAGAYYADAVAWAAQVGIVTGYSDTSFGPKDTITREQLAVMLCRFAKLLGVDTSANGSALNSFTDKNNVHDWAADAMAWCISNGILNGVGNNTLAPSSLATRAQVAVMLDRFIELIK